VSAASGARPGGAARLQPAARHRPPAAVFVCLAVLLVGVVAVSLRYGSFVAGGSDSYCYAHQAERWADVLAHPVTARLQTPNPLALAAPWPEASRAFAPAGHVPSAAVPGAIVPMCPAGLSLLMAPLRLVSGRTAMFLVLPICGALLVLATWAIGSRISTGVGLASALLVACSPPFLYQVVQPMSDVPAAAFWTAAVAAAVGSANRHALWSGVATSFAILVRPNLAPMATVIALFFLARPGEVLRARLRTTLFYAAASVPGVAAVAAIQGALYGSPLASGYGPLSALFAADHVVPNLRRYVFWLWDTHTPAVALAALAPVMLPGPVTWLLIGLVGVNLLLYLPYVVFDDWSFLRFWLPSVPLVLVLMVAVLDAGVSRLAARVANGRPARVAALSMALITVTLGVLFVREAAARHTFRLQALETRFERGGRYVADRLPAQALVITSWQSGSVRYYSGRDTLVWDMLDPSRLDEAVAFARRLGREPFFLFERWEEPLFRKHFASSPLGALDWPPMADVASQVRIYRPDDRNRYLRGEPAPTDYAR
jgi:hypothetical protein